tara:strand:+ start:141 stop:515 length:375 start_codon:yes stop_codon:yes gene_type:complete
MSTIKANDLQNASGGIPTVKGQQLIPTAWANINGTGTIAIRDSENVSSLTDDGVGDVVINFATNMANTNFVTVAVASDPQISTTDNMAASYEWSTSYVKIGINNNSGSLRDRAYVNVIVMGGQS